MRALAIFGPNASAWDLRRFELPGAEITVTERIEPATKSGAALIFGGDGTVHHQLAAMVEAQIPLLVVPKGSGNDFAHALGVHSAADALAAWQAFHTHRQNVRNIDVGIITHVGTRNPKPETRNFFCCVAGAGLDSEANRRANAMPRWLRAHGGYALGVVGAVARFRPQPVRVSLADENGAPAVIEDSATMVAIGNAPSYGRGMRIAPRAKLDDGLLDVCFIRRVRPLRLLRFFPRVYAGAHLDMPEIKYAQAARLTIETEAPLDVYADGEFICRTPVEVVVAPRALKVITVPLRS